MVVESIRRETRADLCDGAYTMLSTDNGHTWSEPEFHEAEIARPDGILRRFPAVAMVDPHTDRFLWFLNEGLFDGDDPLQGMLRYQLRYRVSSDGGHTWDTDELMIQQGEEYDVKPHLPGYRWFSICDARRDAWSPAQPWTYTDGGPFHSPSSCSQLLHHSSGRLLWIGNLYGENPRGNRPRYPLVMAEVDTETGLVIRDSVTAIEDRAPGESERLTLSNFHALEDRDSGEVLVTLPRYFANVPMDGARDFRADLTLIRCGLA